jgi:hypothetical protein
MSSKVSHKHVYIVGIIIAVVILVVAGFYVISMMPSSGGDVTLPERCGNGICNFGETEETCPSDCHAGDVDTPTTSGPVTLSVLPATKNIGNGQEFTLDVVLSEGNDIFGFQFDVEYDPDVIEFVKAEEGTFLNNNGADSTFCLDEKLSEGLVKNLVCTRLGRGSVNGDGVIEKLTFKALSEGRSDVSLKNVRISNSVPEQVEATISDGEVIVS